MAFLTSKRKEPLAREEEMYKRDMTKIPKKDKTSRDVPFWYTHPAAKLIKDQIADELAGKKKRTAPQKLWESRAEYKAFPLSVFRKHLYQDRTRQISAPYWQHRRNKKSQKKT